MVDRNCPNDVELVNAINRNKHVVDRHDYIRKIKNELDVSEEVVVNRILDNIKDSENYKTFIFDIFNWLKCRRDV